jgi:hypothetical protein
MPWPPERKKKVEIRAIAAPAKKCARPAPALAAAPAITAADSFTHWVRLAR